MLVANSKLKILGNKYYNIFQNTCQIQLTQTLYPEQRIMQCFGTKKEL